MRTLTIAALAGLAALAAQSAAAKDFVVGLSWNAMDNQLPVKWQEYMQSEGKTQGEAAGVNFKWVINVADANPSRQASNIEDLINQNVNLIIARAEDASAIAASIRAAKAANIPFITFDRQSKTTKPTVHVGGDSYDQAKTTAEAFVALLKEKGVQGKCIELQGSLTDINAVNRSKAWHEVTDKSGVVQTLEVGADRMESRPLPVGHGQRFPRPSGRQLHVPGERLRASGRPIRAGERWQMGEARRPQPCLDRLAGRLSRGCESHAGWICR